MNNRRRAGALETEVLAALWAADHPLTTADVAAALGGDLAHTTIQTILVRLHRKGAVQREPAGRSHAYSPVLDEPGLAAHRMRAMLDRGDDQAAVLSRFVSTLSDDQHRTLQRLLDDGQTRRR